MVNRYHRSEYWFIFDFLSLSEAAQIMFEICKSVDHLHSRDIAHRDLKVIIQLYFIVSYDALHTVDLLRRKIEEFSFFCCQLFTGCVQATQNCSKIALWTNYLLVHFEVLLHIQILFLSSKQLNYLILWILKLFLVNLFNYKLCHQLFRFWINMILFLFLLFGL